MLSDKLSFSEKPRLHNPRMLMGLSGWMDGGEVGERRLLSPEAVERALMPIQSMAQSTIGLLSPPGRRTMPLHLSGVWMPLVGS